ncbi:hypothetical protein D3C72_2107190 [compost metagenome]
MVAGALEQGFDLGETGVEVHFIERRLAFQHQAIKAQLEHRFTHDLDSHAIDGVFQLFDIDH